MILEAPTSAAARVETVRRVGSMNGKTGMAKRVARPLWRSPSGSSLGLNTVFELGRAKRYDSAIFRTYYLKMLHE